MDSSARCIDNEVVSGKILTLYLKLVRRLALSHSGSCADLVTDRQDMTNLVPERLLCYYRFHLESVTPFHSCAAQPAEVYKVTSPASPSLDPQQGSSGVEERVWYTSAATKESRWSVQYLGP